MPDWGALALGLNRDEFVARFAHPFLWGGAVRRSTRPVVTDKLDAAAISQLVPDPGEPAAPLVLAVAKRATTFPSMITIGSAANSDVVVSHSQISRYHACFRLDSDGITLEDAGSSNGTWVGPTRLAKGGPVRVAPGDRLRFGAVEFELISAKECWDRLIADQDQWG